MRVMVTGSNGLIGSEAVAYFAALDYEVLGVDNNMRARFFGPDGDTRWNQQRLEKTVSRYRHIELDIRDRSAVLAAIDKERPDAVIHCAAQPSHDLAAKIPFDDFDTNAVGTLNLLEAVRQSVPKAPFALLSTNKVYGDSPNTIPLKELPTRWDYADSKYEHGIDESQSVDRCLHSLFGASKLAADVLTQEYGKYFGMNTVAFRGGCLTGPAHSGVELHGFLSYLVKTAMVGGTYRIFGYQGKQVRDNIHSKDVCAAIHRFLERPRPGEVYNLGGGKANSCSILEAAQTVQELSGKKLETVYVDQARTGDHICYYSDTRKLERDYPGWKITISLRDTFAEIIDAWKNRLGS